MEATPNYTPARTVVKRTILVTAHSTDQFTTYYGNQKYCEVQSADGRSKQAAWTDESMLSAMDALTREAPKPPRRRKTDPSKLAPRDRQIMEMVPEAETPRQAWGKLVDQFIAGK